MAFLIRLVSAVFIGALVVIVVAAILLFIVWGINRGLQYFLGLLGYEIGDFFGWLVEKLNIKKRRRRRL